MFKRKLGAALRECTAVRVTDFLEGFAEHISDPVRFRTSLMPSVVVSTASTGLAASSSSNPSGLLRTANQDSLVRTIISIERIQSAAIVFLLQKLPEVSVIEQ